MTYPSDEQIEVVRKALVSHVFELAQPNRGDVFSWFDDHAEELARAALASIPPQDERERIVAHIMAEAKRCEAHLKASGGTTGLADAIQAEADVLRVVAKEIEDGAHLQTTTEQEEER